MVRLVAAWTLVGVTAAAAVVTGPREAMYGVYAAALVLALAAWGVSRRVAAAPVRGVWREGRGFVSEHVTQPEEPWRWLGRVLLLLLTVAAAGVAAAPRPTPWPTRASRGRPAGRPAAWPRGSAREHGGPAPEVRDEPRELGDPVLLGGAPQHRRGVQRRGRERRAAERHRLAVLHRYAVVRPEQRLRRRGAHRDDGLGRDPADLGVEPGDACRYLPPVRGLVQAPLAALLPLEVLHDVRKVGVLAGDAGLGERL